MSAAEPNPELLSLEEIAGIPAFLDVAVRLAGRPCVDAAALREMLAAIDAGGLFVESDAWARFRRGSAATAPDDFLVNVADVPSVLRVARRFVRGDAETGSDRIPLVGIDLFDRTMPRGAAFERVAAPVRRRLAPRCFVLDGGADGAGGVAGIHVQYTPRGNFNRRPDLATVTLLRRIAGRDAMTTRAMPIKALEGVEADLEDASLIDPANVLRHWSDNWTRGREMTAADYDALRRAAIELADHRVRLTIEDQRAWRFDGPKLEVLEVETHVAFRRFCGLLAPQTREALGLMAELWAQPNIIRVQTFVTMMAARRNPERFAQAFRAAPYLAHLLSRATEDARGAAEAEGIAEAIDGGERPENIVRRRCESVATHPVRTFDVRAAMGLNARLEHGLELKHVMAVLAAAYPRPGRRKPLSARAIALLGPAVYAIGLRMMPNELSDDLAARVAATIVDGERCAPLPSGCPDAIGWLFQKAGQVGLDQAQARAAALDAFFPMGGKLKRLVELTARWHHAAIGLAAEDDALRFEHLLDLSRQGGASALFPRPPVFDVPERLRVDILASRESCVREGEEMHHCVATYRDRAAAGDILLLSIRDDERRSTASLRIDRAWRRVLLDQVRGPSNREPPHAQIRFAADLAETLRHRLTDETAEARRWRDALADARACADAVAAAERADARMPALADARFALMRPFLPRAERGLSRDAWVARRRGPPQGRDDQRPGG